MMCYRDMTFCDFKKCEKFGKCPRSMTKKVLQDSEKWWGNPDAPICMYSHQPKCFRVELRK